MKRIIRNVLSIVIMIALTLSLSACDFGSKRVTDIQQYGKLEHYIELPEFFPNSVEGYSVNAYAYNLESWMDVCHEIFLDITVTESQFYDLLSEYMSNSVDCYYSDGFYEIVFQDSYTIFNDGHNEEQVVGYADIEKIVYNPETYRIVFVVFHANDTGVYPLKDVAYFNCFNIDENEYVKHLKDNNKAAMLCVRSSYPSSRSVSTPRSSYPTLPLFAIDTYNDNRVISMSGKC